MTVPTSTVSSVITNSRIKFEVALKLHQDINHCPVIIQNTNELNDLIQISMKWKDDVKSLISKWLIFIFFLIVFLFIKLILK